MLLNQRSLVVSPSNKYRTQFELSLGSTPLRGAVWIEPTLASETKLNVSFVPSRVVLYDSNVIATVIVQVENVNPDSASLTLVVNNRVLSCDAAFMEFTEAIANRETTVYIDVLMPDDEDETNLAVVISVSFAVVATVALGVFFYFERKRRMNDAVWKVKKEELIFGDPPVIVGRGTFGLVLLAEYRGTQVAIKRVIPPKQKNRSRHSSMGSITSFEDKTENSAGKNSGLASGLMSGSMVSGSSKLSSSSADHGTRSLLASTLRRSSGGWARFTRSNQTVNWEKLKQDFVKEMRYLSKLRHPCITTVMGKCCPCAPAASRPTSTLILCYAKPVDV